MRHRALPARLLATFMGGAAACTAAAEPAPPALDEAGAALFRRVDPSVVAIQHEQAGGSGVIVTPDGYILTNGHVVMGEDDEDPRAVAKRITVILHDDRKFTARVIGHSLDPDVALIKIDPDAPLTPAVLGDSDQARAGQHCYAFGMPQGYKRTLTAGIVSNAERTDLETFTVILQTDAAINPGNSGGPLFNERGEVLGLNTYKSWGDNIGFTIPVNVAKVLREHFLAHGRFRRAVVPGLVLQELYDELARAVGVERGVLVDHVAPGSEAERCGLRAGDVITAVDGKPAAARARSDLLRLQWDLVTRTPGATVRFSVRRGAAVQEVAATLHEDDPAPAWGHQAGEIPQELYDELGLGVQRISPRARLLYDLPDDAGVLVNSVLGSTPAERAGLQPRDIVTSVEGTATPDLDAFRTRLEALLGERRPAIRLDARRHKDMIHTAIAPSYSLAGKRIALAAGPEDAWAPRLLRRAFAESGAGLAAPGAPFDALVIIGGREAVDAERVRAAAAGGKVIAALGEAPLGVLKAEPSLLARKMTVEEGRAPDAMAMKARYTGKVVERDGKLVTGTGFDKSAVKAFLRALKGAVNSP